MSIAFERAKKTFLGFLQARGKSWNTVRNYASDLQSFGDFCDQKKLDFQKLSLKQLEAYHFELKRQNLSNNSRRRKLLTVKGFLKYLSGRMDVSMVGAEKWIAPEKIEKTPHVLNPAQLQTLIQMQPESELGLRNQALIALLADTGMLVTEALALRFEDFSTNAEGGSLQILGKRARTVSVKKQAAVFLEKLQTQLKGHAKSYKRFFHGYSKLGPKTEKLTPRAVEMLFQNLAKSLQWAQFHPRSLRHFFVIQSILEGKDREHITRVLGLKTAYAFRVYEPYFSTSSAETTYTADVDPQAAADRLKWAGSIKKELRKERKTHKDSGV